MANKYSAELKSTVLREIRELGMSTSGTAKKYEIPLKTVENWVTKYNKNPQVFHVNEMSNVEKIEFLQKENSRLKRDNEILKKTLRLLARKEL